MSISHSQADIPRSTIVASMPAMSTASTSAPDHAVVIPVLAAKSNGGLAALADGLLYWDGSCFWLAAASGPLREAIVWPAGFSARSNPARVLDDKGKVVARAGLKASLGGGGIPIVPKTVRPGTAACLKGQKNAWYVAAVGGIG